MSAYFIATYDIADPATYARYNPGSMETIGATLARHGGKLLAAGDHAQFLGDGRRDVAVALEFPTAEAAHAWHEDPDYQAVAKHRLDSTTNVVAWVIEMPSE
jgi:uncharacterized protein (DUF1330 family)